MFKVIDGTLCGSLVLLRNDSLKSLGKLFCGVIAVMLQKIVEGNYLRDDGNIFSWKNRELDVGNLHIQNRNRGEIEAGAGKILGGLPFHQFDHYFDPLLETDRSNTKNALNVNKAESADLHKVLDQIGSCTDENSFSFAGHVDDIVGNQSMTALY